MPTLHIRAVPSELMARLKASARDSGEPIDDHAIDLIDDALITRERRRAGGLARAAQRTTEDQRAAGQARARQRQLDND